LTQLKEEYDLIRENCSKTKAVLGKKGESIQELEMRYKDAEARHQKAQNLADAQDAIKELKREMAWAHVAEKEVELAKAIDNTARENQRLAQIQVKLDEAQKQVSEAGEKINDAETRVQQAASPEELNQQLDEVNAQVVAGRDELRKAKVSVPKLFMLSWHF
jgi:structural maintenance of chromosomes protein 6